MSKNTARELLLAAMKEQGESEPDLQSIAYQEIAGDRYENRWGAIIPCQVTTDLPPRAFGSGYGGSKGPKVIAWSERFVYVWGVYDGKEWMTAVPRNPRDVPFIPRIGGK